MAEIKSPFRSIHFYLPQKALDDIAGSGNYRGRPALEFKQGTSVDDPTVRSLISSLEPLMCRPERSNKLFIDHVAMALTAHVADTYCGLLRRETALTGGLTPRQESLAKDMLVAALDGNVSLRDLADGCDLSERHFSRAFKRSVGVAPHRWLTLQRIERSKQLLQSQNLTMADIAMTCGFADQSHFSRTFRKEMGCSPRQWLRQRN